MLKIRSKQFEEISRVMRERFVAEMLEHVHEVFPPERERRSPAETRALIEKGIDQAGMFEITREREVMLFIDLMFGVHLEFEAQRENQWMLSILQNPKFNQQEKMDLVYTRLKESAASA